jgi:NADH-quinone oxidoreductase subunit C
MEITPKIQDIFSENKLGFVVNANQAYGETTIECPVQNITKLLTLLKNNSNFKFDSLIDLCAVDYLDYGKSDWQTDFSSGAGYSRGVETSTQLESSINVARFAVVYHLLSTSLNHRCRVKVFLDEDKLSIPTVTKIWVGANWFEREAYDLYGILFENHEDLRRILTDYGFIGHPFRKDFPLSGRVEMRYDATLQRVIYEPVEIEARVLVPKVIREDNRYQGEKEGH